MAKGKFEEWLTDDGLLLIEGWARDGLTDEQIAHNMGINPATLYKWQKEHSEISNALKKGKAPVDFEVENALLKRALGYSAKEVMTEELVNADGSTSTRTRTTLKPVPPDVTAQIFWLKNRRPDKWRDKQIVQNTEALERMDAILRGLGDEADAETE